MSALGPSEETMVSCFLALNVGWHVGGAVVGMLVVPYYLSS